MGPIWPFFPARDPGDPRRLSQHGVPGHHTHPRDPFIDHPALPPGTHWHPVPPQQAPALTARPYRNVILAQEARAHGCVHGGAGMYGCRARVSDSAVQGQARMRALQGEETSAYTEGPVMTRNGPY